MTIPSLGSHLVPISSSVSLGLVILGMVIAGLALAVKLSNGT